ncbi:MAG: heme ABC exporter ATP-binding protein CcmA [Rhodobiaceae bacterium]|jgi:heme exporter protein A|nr:heme ABC exporter ATP-binding protein CcmA [Rhodobiaceae bacterium]|tara:strand:- start:786 stop:1358 length:573 start_codon:yes stop_codon:yes gene_type:complete
MTLLVKNLSCSLSGRKIISDINFSLKNGEILKISGENGSGKTTLLRTISGLSSFESGEILINKKEIFLLGHNAGIKQNLTVEEDLEFWSNFYQNKHDDIILKKLNLKSKMHSQCRYLSQGQKQKLALTRLFCSNKSIWLLDEPFSFLDEESSIFLLNKIEKHRQNDGIAIIVSHQNLIKNIDFSINLGAQ